MLVGEALGANEERAGKPFVGDAGRKLTYLLSRARIKRKSLLITNSVRCRPPRNRTPKAEELEACWPYLLGEILVTKPEVVVTLGAVAQRQVLGTTRSIDSWRGFPKSHTFVGCTRDGRKVSHTCWVISTYHPSACLHNWMLDDRVVDDLVVAQQYADGTKHLKWPDTKYRVADTLVGVEELFTDLYKKRVVSVDTETTGLDVHTSDVLAVGFCATPGDAFILPLLGRYGKQIWQPEEKRYIIRLLTVFLENTTLIGQNLKFDVQFFRKLTGLADYTIAMDTMIAHRAIDENAPHNLTFLCQKYLGWLKYDELTKVVDGSSYATLPTNKLYQYLSYDVDGPLRLAVEFERLIDEEGVRRAYETDLGLIEPIADMEYRGIKIHRERISVLSEQYREKIRSTEKALDRIARKVLKDDYKKVCRGAQFNPRSPIQLGEVLKRAAKGKMTKETPTGKVSTDKRVLAALAINANSTPGKIAIGVKNLRLWGPKYVSQFLDGPDGRSGILSFVGTKDRVHTNYNLAKTRTGRLSNDDPPLQTYPRMGGIRSIIIPDTPDHVLVAADYAKLELCVMAWLANDGVMCKELIEGQDLHSRMAITRRLGRDPTDEEFNELLDSVSKPERALAKATNFGIPYGISDYSIAEDNPSAFDSSMPMKKRVETVSEITRAYYEKYHMIRDFLQWCIEEAHERGYLVTWKYRRKRRLYGTRWFDSKWGIQTLMRDKDLGHLEREARNFPVQSLASDILGTATRKIWLASKKARLPGFRVVLSHHDALVACVRRDVADETEAFMRDQMETFLPKTKTNVYHMPIRVDVQKQEWWGQEYMTDEEKSELAEWYSKRGVGLNATGEITYALPPAFARKIKRTFTRKIKRTWKTQKSGC